MLINASSLSVRKNSQEGQWAAEVWGQAEKEYVDPVVVVAADLCTSTANTSAGHQEPATTNRCSHLHTEPQLYGPLQNVLEQRALKGHPFQRPLVHTHPDFPEEKETQRTRA